MSLSGLLSAVSAASQLFAGYGTVTLGPVQFTGLGKPKSIPIGGKQAIVTHKLPGGGRVLDAMGPDNADIAWSGYLDGQDATVTARALDKLRQSGQAVVLAWDVFSYQVLVSEFSCNIRHIPMPYRITCTVIADNSQIAAAQPVSLALQVASDLSVGSTVGSLSAVSQSIVGSSISVAADAAEASGATTLGSAAYTNAVNVINSAISLIESAMTAASLSLSATSSSLSSLSVNAPIDVDIEGMSTQIANAASACGDLANLASSAGYVGRSAANLQRTSA